MGDYFDKYQKRRLITTNISVVVSISVVLFLLGVLLFFVLNSKNITNHFKEKIVITVFFKKDVKTTEIKQFEKSIKLMEEIKSTKYVSGDQAAKQFMAEIGEDFVKFLGDNPIRDNLEISLNGDFVNESIMSSLKKKWLQKSFVSEVNYAYYKPLIKVLNGNVKQVSFWIVLVSSIFLVLVFLLINSAIRLSVYSKRFGIRTMQLVGATRGFIRRPFLLKGILLGLIGATLASIGLFATLFYLDKAFPDFSFLSDIKLLSILFGSIYAVGIIITILSTFFATRRFFNLSTEQLHS